MAFDGLHRVIRAGRIKAAGSAEKGTEDELIRAHGKEQQARAQAVARSADVSRSSNSRSIAAKGAVATELRG